LFAFDHGHKNERMTEIYGPIELIADSFFKETCFTCWLTTSLSTSWSPWQWHC